MIVLDLEMSGIFPEKHGIWQIGAIELENPNNFFVQECRIDDGDEIFPQALLVTGKTEEQLRDKNKQSQKQLLHNFFKWIETIQNKTIIAQNPGFDLMFVYQKSRKYGINSNLPYRTFDLHAISAIKYYQVFGKFLLSDIGDKSNMDLTNVMKFCGMKDDRRIINQQNNNVIQEGKPHDALGDAKMTAECFSRIVYGKNLIKDFKDSRLPNYLAQN